MQTVKPQEQELRKAVNQAKYEPGLRALVDLAAIHRDAALNRWRGASGPDLVKYQTEYNAMQRVIDFILVAPRDFEKPAQ